LKKQPNVKVK